MLTNEEIEEVFRTKKLMIGIPEKWMWGNSTTAMWAISFAVMKKFDNTAIKADAQAPLSACRNRLVRLFWDEGYDYLFFIDDDTVPPKDALWNLVKYSDEYDILSGLYFRKSKRKAYKPVAFANIHRDEHNRWWWNTLIRWPRSGVVGVSGFGMGCCLIPRYAIGEILKQQGQPLFRYEFDETDGWIRETENGFMAIGEDLYFCKKAIDSNLKLGIVADVLCEHTGPHASVGVRQFEEAVIDGLLLGQSYNLPITTIDQRMLIEDAATYFKQKPEKIMEEISFGTVRYAQEIREKRIPYKTQAQRDRYLLSHEKYLFHLLGWNYFFRDKIVMRNKLAIMSEGKVLDYGASTGDIAVRCNSLGLDMTYYEKPSVMFDFFKFRCKKRNMNINCVEMHEDKDLLSDKVFDTVICFDFLEFVLDPIKHLRRIKKHSHEKTKFLMALDNRRNVDEHPFFIRHKDELDMLFKKAGMPKVHMEKIGPSKHVGIMDETGKKIDYM